MNNNTEKTLMLTGENYQVNMYGSTFIGTRDYQQDRMLTYQQDSLSVAVVCDGMGGMESGEKASQTAVDMFLEKLKMLNGTENVKNFLCRMANDVNYEISSFKDEYGKPLRSGTTAVMAVAVEDVMHVMSVGDSRIYIIRNGRLKQLTSDHNYMLRLEEQFRHGIIDRKKYEEEKPRAGALISFLGIGEPIIVDVKGPYKLLPGDIVLLCSDGLTKGLSNCDIEKIVSENVRSVPELPDILIGATKANMPRGMDNTTVVVLQYD